MSSPSYTSQQQRDLIHSNSTSTNSEREGASFEDFRPETLAQAKMVEDIHSSPKSVAQRLTHEKMFGEQNGMQLKEKETSQLMPDLEEEEKKGLVQGKFNQQPIQREAANGLPENVNNKLESTLNADFSGVNIHANSNQATEMGALAYAQGNDIHFAPGQFKPNTSSGLELIGHEFAHVVQQAEGKVKPTTEVNGMPVNDNKGLENEADQIGRKVARN